MEVRNGQIDLPVSRRSVKGMLEHLIEGCRCKGKCCPYCKQTKCYSAFHKDRVQKDGLRTCCKKCAQEQFQPYKPIDEDLVEEIVALYQQGLSPRTIAYQLHRNEKTIKKVLDDARVVARPKSSYNIQRGTAQVDHHFFDIIDSEEKAYWLGFITADGGVSNNYLAVSQHINDASHLEMFRQSLKIGNAVKPHGSSSVWIQVRSQHLCEALAHYGVVPRKSWIAKPADIDPQLARHYWRGLVDGDGSISWNRHKGIMRPKLQYCGTYDMVDGFLAFCRTIIPTQQKPGPTRWEGHFHCTFSYKMAREIAKALYEDATFFLERKMKVYLSFFRKA
jgi:hypothetical protein